MDGCQILGVRIYNIFNNNSKSPKFAINILSVYIRIYLIYLMSKVKEK